jgi:RND family efflux transporter MFP subunit
MKHMNAKKIIIILIILIITLFLAWKIYLKLKQGSISRKAGSNNAVAVEIKPIIKGSLRDIANHTGTLIAKTRVIVAPKIAARLSRLPVNIGDAVKNGQLLAVLDDEEYRQQVIQAEADLQVAAATVIETKSSLVTAEKKLERARALHKTGIQSDAQLDEIESEYQSQLAKSNVAEAQRANRQAALANARLRLSYTRIAASWDKGTRYIGERFADEGTLLAVNTPILSIVELQPIIAIINVTDQEYFRVKVGQPAAISSTAFPGKTFSGKVARIAPLLQETSRQARVEIEVENPELILKPGMFLNIQIEYSQRNNITIVPYNALAKRNEEQGIFLVNMENKSARFIPIETGIIEKGQVEIIKPADLSGYVVEMGHYLLEMEGKIILPEISNDTAISEKSNLVLPKGKSQ